MAIGLILIDNHIQTVSLPDEVQFPDDVKKVYVRIQGNDRILSPADKTWDSFFLAEVQISNDFLNYRAAQTQSEREHL